MKVMLGADEWYPVYSTRDQYGLEVEVEPEAMARWTAAEEAFRAAQDEMGDVYEAAEKVRREREAQAKAEKEAADKAERDRIAQVRRDELAARQARQEAMWEQIKASGGEVYDADGNPVGTVYQAGSGVRLEP